MGSGEYTVAVGDASATGTVVVAGFIILNEGRVVSGEGITVGQKGSYQYDVKAIGVDGREVDVYSYSHGFYSDTLGDIYFREVEEASFSLDGIFKLDIADYRMGTGKFFIGMHSEAIILMGEEFETILLVNQETSPEPPCVAIGDDIPIINGYIMVPMYNLLSPPLSAPVSEVTISVGDETAVWDTSKSVLSNPDQTVAFKISATGVASIKCDGEDAEIVDGNLLIIDQPSASLSPSNSPAIKSPDPSLIPIASVMGSASPVGDIATPSPSAQPSPIVKPSSSTNPEPIMTPSRVRPRTPYASQGQYL